MTMLPLLGDNHCLPLLHIAKRLFGFKKNRTNAWSEKALIMFHDKRAENPKKYF